MVSRVAESLLSLALLDSPLSSLNSFLEAAGDPRLDSRVLLSTAHNKSHCALLSTWSAAAACSWGRVWRACAWSPPADPSQSWLSPSSPSNYHHPVSVSHYHRLKIDWVNFSGILVLSKRYFLELSSIVKPIARIPNTALSIPSSTQSLCPSLILKSTLGNKVLL